jgi:putative two-component system response regulator
MPDNKYVLVVEDDSFYQKIYKTKLAKEDISAELASNGDEAIKIIKERGAPSLMMLDLIMPGKDGFQTLAEIKASPEMKDIPVIVLSNLSQEEDIKRIMEMGATEYLIKANTPIQDIVSRLKNALLAN